MRALSWNCRGLGHPWTIRELAEVARLQRPDIIGLQETKIEVSRLEVIRRRLGFKFGFQVPRQGLAGGLALWWKEEESVSGRRNTSWDLLRRLNTLYRLPWIVFGDFNEVCFSWEVKGGRIRGEWQMRAFREALMDCCLTDLGYKGNPYTFSNRRSGVLETRARLDRMLANYDWRKIFSNAQGLIIIKQTTMLQRGVSKWNDEKFGKVGQRIKELKQELELIRLCNRDTETIKKEADTIAKIDEWRLREEVLWRQRSRAEWLKEGDRNTSYFHAKASQRKKINTIKRLQIREGEWISDEGMIRDLIREYFTNIFSSSTGNSDVNYENQFRDIKRRITSEMANKLCDPVTALEVQAAIFQMSPTKAPGPDGFHALFYQKYWHTIKDSVTTIILKVFNEGRMEEGMNDTIIVLVPKIKKPKRVEDFRPISLCNVSTKIVMKILANRLKDILPHIISDTQSAFVPGRLISDNILLAHEVLHYLKTRRSQKVGFFSMKTDMSKAYDRMEWKFMESMLLYLGFPTSWIRLVMQCVRSVRYKVKFNDLIIDIPPPERGLRQGDPLSPYLFLLCFEWLSMRIGTEIASQRLKGVKIFQGPPMISHLFFADDSIFFVKATMLNAGRLKMILKEYMELSDTVCKRIARIIQKFSWSVDGESREISWAGQAKLSLPKEEGGLNFRELATFNDALLAKQFWRLLEHPNSIISKTLKAKYYKQSIY
ncbi:hypothetical protein QQ045_017139 [Rhodiola kirilowii]